MGKRIGLKAFVLLVVIFFHSFVLVPKVHATAWEGIAGRLAYRAMAPSVIAALGSGTALVIGAVVAGGVGYLIYKSDAVTALQNWLNANPLNPGQAVSGFKEEFAGMGAIIYSTYNGWFYWVDCSNGNNCTGGSMGTYTWSYANMIASGSTGDHSYAAQYNSKFGTSPGPLAAPTVPIDYADELSGSQPSFPWGSIFATLGTAAAISGSTPIISATTMSDSDADKFIAGLGATPVDSSGVQEGAPPITTDNTVTAGDTAQIGILQSIMNYVSNLIGIKTIAEQAKTTLDNSLVVQQGIKQSMDNTLTVGQEISGKLDNVVEGVNSLTGTSATEASLSTRISGVKNAMLTKFPFAIVAAVTSPGEVAGGTYSIPNLHFPLGLEVVVDPMQHTEIADWVTWLRGLMAISMWAIFLLVMVRRVCEL